MAANSSTLRGQGGESDLGELAALFAAHSGGNFSPEVSAELALDIVLHEIVEQACLATGATGAAIILERDGDLVCRASSGANAPELGARLGSESGLTAQCIRTRQVQRCYDAQADPRADAEASRNLGVRSVMIFPLLRNGGMVGLLEIFSSKPGAFGERDELKVEALAHRVLKNLERAHQVPSSITAAARAAAEQAARPVPAPAPKLVPPPAASEWRGTLSGSFSGSAAGSSSGSATSAKKEGEFAGGRVARPRVGLDVATVVLGAAVLICAMLLATLVGFRLGWRSTAALRGQVTKPVANAVTSEEKSGTSAGSFVPARGNSAVPASGDAVGDGKNGAAAGTRSQVLPPEGGLSVYENGKEVFRMPPASSGATVEISPQAAEGGLVRRVEPEYPEEARQQQIQGDVVLDVRVDRDGAVKEVNLISGPKALADAAIAAVKQWRFRPRTVNGRPVEMQTKVTLYFRMPV